MKEIRTNSPKEMKKAAADMAVAIAKKRGNEPRVFALKGELGSGKTTFAQGFAEGIGVKERVLSPTFVVMREFQIPGAKGKLYHIDAYRLQKEKDLLDLGWSDILKNPDNVVLVEWADRVKEILPPNTTWLRFENLGGEKRSVLIAQEA
ncbi:MAG: tRNA (adenosine(37)-N6)-threonylcarbamoyltransferase complex ATPase subunit type 1 TsaE [bacterium]|nr:tRNA (adenosine(37)-N6)-threonylcarbamoyltransferase complex ATPase subunit type 1 TsaE [bacterium]MDZ4231707.1 tRNA (adenosine(37)-N6)-threonylcarbamoyltransferase complex ATPase subunit type 1 TsaE [Candidatus Pacearchaeota archaeon]